MAVLWQQDSAGRWAALPLPADLYVLSATGVKAAQAAGHPDLAGLTGPWLRRSARHGEQWLLLTASNSSVRVNGRLPVLGIRVLRNRDEILLPAEPADRPCRFFFSSEGLAQVERLPETDGQVSCGRCKQSITPGTPAVRCPNPACGVWHHQTDELPCWTYGEHCALCDTRTAMNAEFKWSPEEL